jgi:hypothetical protein
MTQATQLARAARKARAPDTRMERHGAEICDVRNGCSEWLQTAEKCTPEVAALIR